MTRLPKYFCSLCGYQLEIASVEVLKYAGRNGSKEVKTCVNCAALKGGNGFQRAEYQRRYDEAGGSTSTYSGARIGLIVGLGILLALKIVG